MEIKAAKSLRVSHINHRYYKSDVLTLTLGLGLSLIDGKVLAPSQAYGALIQAFGPYAAKGLAFDLGVSKLRGEFLALAAAEEKPGEIGPTLASFTVGPVSRLFAVLPEKYTDDRVSVFKSKVLSWENAAYDPKINPLGVIPQETYGEFGVQARAQVFGYLKGHNGGLGEVLPGPASPLPLPPDLARSERLGTFGDKWLHQSWPGFPRDFDFDVFNLAQEPQRLPSGYFYGDEAIILRNLHPTKEILKTALPGLKPRVFIKTASGVAEFGSRLDTVWLAPLVDTAIILWRSVIPVQNEKNSDVELVVVGLEPLANNPAPLESWLERAKKGQELEPPLLIGDLKPKDPAPQRTPKPPAPAKTPTPKVPQAPFKPTELEKIPPLTAEDIVQGSQNLLAQSLPEINAKLAALGYAPLALADLLPHLAGNAKVLSKLMAEPSPASPPPLSEASLKAALDKSSLGPIAKENFLKAAKTPPPIRESFPDQASFTAAVAKFSDGWALALGAGPTFSEGLTKNLLASGEDALSQRLSGYLSPKAVSQLTAPKALSPAAPSFKDLDWSRLGLSKEAGAKAGALMDRLNAIASAKVAVPFADKMAALNQLAPELDAALGLAAGTMAGNFAQNAQTVKKLAWGSEEMGRAIANLANDPLGLELKAILPKLEALRLNPPLKVGSLRELGLLAGITNLSLLDRLALFDPLAGAPKVKEGLPLKPAKEPNVKAPDKPSGPTKGLGGILIFTSREMVVSHLKDPQASLAKSVLVGLNLADLDFANRDLTKADLRESDLREAKLTGAKLKGATLEGANLSGAILSGASLVSANLTGAKLEKVKALGADFSEATLSGVDFTSVALGQFKAPKAYFAKTVLPKDLAAADLAGASFRDLSLAGFNLAKANLADTDFYEVNLTGADLREANLTKAVFEACLLAGANLAAISAPRLRIFKCHDLAGANFYLADLTGMTLVSSAANGTNFQGVKADGANLRELTLTASDWRGASLKEAVLFRSDLTAAKLMRANLFKAVLGGAILKGADLSGASLYGADLYRAELDGYTNLKGADLNSTILMVLKPDLL